MADKPGHHLGERRGIPCIATYCEVCGFVSLHAATIVGLLKPDAGLADPEPEAGDGSK